MEELSVGKSHKMIISNRQNASFSGISDVISFDETEVVLETTQGQLMIKGKRLHVNHLTLEKGEVDLTGNIDSLIYSDRMTGKGSESILGRLFR